MDPVPIDRAMGSRDRSGCRFCLLIQPTGREELRRAKYACHLETTSFLPST
jgi:hypothetical protein